jgi:hypothetical protein
MRAIGDAWVWPAVRLMSALRGLAEALRQLLDARQYQYADRLLDDCTQETLAGLLQFSEYVLTHRAASVVKASQHRRKTSNVSGMHTVLEALRPVFNRWCLEGRRNAIRAVLNELDESNLATLAGLPELDGEVISISREFHWKRVHALPINV